jgi:hypothetical protein
MLSNLMRAPLLAGALALAACSSSPEAPASSAGVDSSSGGNASTAGSAGNATAGSDVTGTGGTVATGGSSGTESVVDAGEMAPDGQGCGAVTEQHPSEGALHQTAICSPLVYGTNPPSSGTHYPIWAAYQTYTKPFLPGFWVHNLEHGAVVITYNCPDGCVPEVAEAQAFIDALPADCPDYPHKRRVIMLPDPDLDVRFAASSWLFTLRASCFDRAAFAKFAADHIGHGLEPICDDGYDPLTAATGGKPICP